MVTIALICLIVVQQAFYLWQIHKLINKLMSRNYYDYGSVTKPEPKRKINIQDPGEPEDLRELDAFKIQLPIG